MSLIVVATFSLLVIAALLAERVLAERRWSGERHALLNRVQHPAIYQPTVTYPSMQEPLPADFVQDEYELAGRVMLDGQPEEGE